MPHLLSILLQATPPASAAALAGLVLSGISLLLVVLMWLRKESREDGLTTAQRLKKLETSSGLHDTNTTLLQRQIEDFTGKLHNEVLAAAEKAENARGNMQQELHRRCSALEKEAAKVQDLSRDVAVMKRDIERIPMIERKLDEMIRLLTETLSKK